MSSLILAHFFRFRLATNGIPCIRIANTILFTASLTFLTFLNVAALSQNFKSFKIPEDAKIKNCNIKLKNKE